MLKLMKYDFRRNRDQILGLYTVTLLLEAVIWILAEVYHWEKLSMFVLQAVTYVSAAVFLVVLACRTYSTNLKSYSRKLIPVKTLFTVLSPLLLNLILLIALIALAMLHAAIYGWVYPDILPVDFWYIFFISVLNSLGAAMVFLIALTFSITVSHSLPFRSKVWIGILTLFVLNLILGLVEGKLFPDSGGWMELAFRYNFTSGEYLNPNGIEAAGKAFDIGPALIETVFCLILLYASTWLVKKKVEI
ncbi:hypothetical protein A8L34_10235 [Bacillus sp. FJAT-27264]|uniref:hypothetical protein n=1 Tax=Paenibacillus sp. (strain DSM 101736 / FJAT-27264) TaxID=1850362 RepID=UPI000807A2F4|nr:hypothetical protein [Bacillus sp. FJAT-27264]OBZ14318.1 hypothetical protein A8L34_10235 [Bacillus sp. FJAT-27264]